MTRRFSLSPRVRGLLLGLFATLIWGFQYPIGRFVFGEGGEAVDPFFASLVRFLCGAIVVLPFALTSSPARNFVNAIRQDFGSLLCLGLFGIMLESLLATSAVKFTTAARSGLLCNLSPIFTVLFAAAAARRWPSKSMVIGMLIGFAGIYLAITSTAKDAYTDNGGSALLGDCLAVCAGISWAYYTVACHKTAEKHGAMVCTVILLIISALGMFLWCVCTGTSLAPSMPLRVWLGLLFLGFLASGIAVGAWYAATTMVSADSLGAYGYLSAFISMTSSQIIAHERLSLRFYLAIIPCIIAIWLMNRTAKSTTPVNDA